MKVLSPCVPLPRRTTNHLVTEMVGLSVQPCRSMRVFCACTLLFSASTSVFCKNMVFCPWFQVYNYVCVQPGVLLHGVLSWFQVYNYVCVQPGVLLHGVLSWFQVYVFVSNIVCSYMVFCSGSRCLCAPTWCFVLVPGVYVLLHGVLFWFQVSMCSYMVFCPGSRYLCAPTWCFVLVPGVYVCVQPGVFLHPGFLPHHAGREPLCQPGDHTAQALRVIT